MDILDFSDLEYSDRNGAYGGNAGLKDGVLYNGEYWIVKYPKSTRGMDVKEGISYTSSPLSEYIGSHVYEILGYDVHETLLVVRNGKLAVACKDFCGSDASLREIRTIKNFANKELSDILESKPSGENDSLVDIDELLLHLNYNDILKKALGIKERFFDCIVIDVFINNNDRNNGNWGLLYKDGNYSVAPVFDNGASFSNKLSDREIEKAMALYGNAVERSLNTTTMYSRNGKPLTSKKILELDERGILDALDRNVPCIQRNMLKIIDMINEIPETYGEINVCSKVRKDFYILGMMTRLEKLLVPALNKQKERELISVNGEDTSKKSFKKKF